MHLVMQRRVLAALSLVNPPLFDTPSCFVVMLNSALRYPTKMMMVDYEKTNPNIKRIPVSHAPFPPFSKGAETHFKILKHPLG